MVSVPVFKCRDERVREAVPSIHSLGQAKDGNGLACLPRLSKPNTLVMYVLSLSFIWRPRTASGLPVPIHCFPLFPAFRHSWGTKAYQNVFQEHLRIYSGSLP